LRRRWLRIEERELEAGGRAGGRAGGQAGRRAGGQAGELAYALASVSQKSLLARATASGRDSHEGSRDRRAVASARQRSRSRLRSGDDESNREREGGGTRDPWSRGYDAADPPETGASRILHWKTSACHLAGAGVEGIAGALPTSDPTGLSKVFRAVSHRAKPYLDIRPGGVTIAA
jgi:hypothetical protein